MEIFIKSFDNAIFKIIPYSSQYRMLLEGFRKKTFLEGNESLSREKLNPDELRGLLLLLFVDNELASISVCEASHYTGDDKTVARICRFHVLKKFRHCNAGFRMIRQQLEWAKSQGFKSIYWTNDINKDVLNVLYRHERKIARSGLESEYEIFKSFKLRNDLLFRVSQKSNFLQYVYEYKIEKDFLWMPKKNMIFYRHDGKDVDIDEVFKIEEVPNQWYFQTQLGKSSIHGVGRFSQDKIPANEIVVKLNGILAKREKKIHFLPIDDNTELRSQPAYINHSCNPNLKIERNDRFISIKKIAIGDELTIDYSTLIENGRDIFSECLCQSKYCKKKITGLRNFIL